MSRATTPAATRRCAPAATSSTTAATAASSSAAGRVGRPDHERHLALRRYVEPLGEGGCGLTDDLLVELRQLAADRDAPVRIGRREARQSRRQALRRFERDRRMRPRRQLLPQRRPLLLAPREVAHEPVLLACEAARDERGLDGRRPRQDRDGDPRGDRGGDEPRPRVVDAGKAGVGDERDPLAGLEPRDEIDEAGRLVVLVIREEPRLDPVALEEDPRVTRVLAQDRVRGAPAPRARGA